MPQLTVGRFEFHLKKTSAGERFCSTLRTCLRRSSLDCEIQLIGLTLGPSKNL